MKKPVRIKWRICSVVVCLSACALLAVVWWNQTTLKIRDFDGKFDSDEIIDKIESITGCYVVSGLENIFVFDQRRKISTISLSQGRGGYGNGSDVKIVDKVTVKVWIGYSPEHPIMYGCRHDEHGDLIVRRLYIEYCFIPDPSGESKR